MISFYENGQNARKPRKTQGIYFPQAIKKPPEKGGLWGIVGSAIGSERQSVANFVVEFGLLAVCLPLQV